MNTHVDKQELKKWVDEVEDQAVLEGLQSLKEDTQKMTSWATLPPAVKAGIKEGRKDINAGRVIANEDFWERYEQSL